MNSKQINKDIRKYLKRIKDELTCSSNLKSAFTYEFKEQIKYFINDNADTTIDDIINNFGCPKEIANSFKSPDDFDRLNKLAKKYKYIKTLAVIASIVIIMSLIVIIILLSLQNDIIDIKNY
jgi:uncharacterized membrane protein